MRKFGRLTQNIKFCGLLKGMVPLWGFRKRFPQFPAQTFNWRRSRRKEIPAAVAVGGPGLGPALHSSSLQVQSPSFNSLSNFGHFEAGLVRAGLVCVCLPLSLKPARAPLLPSTMRAGVSLAVLLFCLHLGHNLQCQKCVSRDGNCTGATNIELCGPTQDSCFFEIKQFLDVSADTVKRGCGTANACRRYPEGYRGHLFHSIYCCSSDFCEPVSYHASRAGSPNGLRCQSCIGNSAECGREAPSEPCRGEANQCIQISQRFLPGEEQEPLIKGCGGKDFEDALLAYQVGGDFAYMDQKVCRLNNCNNRSFPDIPAGRPNGLQCYTCWESRRGDCAPERLLPLNCSGEMDRCLHVIGKGDGGAPVTLQKGCATETMCGRHQEIYRKLKGPGSFVSCCKGWLCNRAGGLSVPLVGLVLALGLALMAWK